MSQTAVKNEKPPVQIGWTAAEFKLKGTDGKFHTPSEAKGDKGLVVIFMCNHCPYVQGALERIIRDMSELKGFGIGAIGIMPNDTKNYPDDSFENMQKLASSKSLPFPYVIDESQEVAKAYDAVCTPEFYGFDSALKLVYHGRLDAGGKNLPPAGSPRELFEAMKSVAEDRPLTAVQRPSMGCTIKWKK